MPTPEPGVPGRIPTATSSPGPFSALWRKGDRIAKSVANYTETGEVAGLGSILAVLLRRVRFRNFV